MRFGIGAAVWYNSLPLAASAATALPISDAGSKQGFVASLAHPGGSVTGVSWLNTELSAKRLELLKEALPEVTRVAVLREAVGGASSEALSVLPGPMITNQMPEIVDLASRIRLPAVFPEARFVEAGGR